MKKNIIRSFVIIVLFALGSVMVSLPVHAATVLIDWSTSNDISGSADGNGNFWNSLGSGAVDVTTTALVDDTGAASGWSVAVDREDSSTSGSGFGGTGINGPVGATAPFDLTGSDRPTVDGLYANNNTDGTALFLFTGLSANSDYDFSMIGGRASSGKDGVLKVLQGTPDANAIDIDVSNVESDDLLDSYQLLNNGTIASFTITATASGEIEIQFYKGDNTAGGSGNSTFNAMSITEGTPDIAPPSHVLLSPTNGATDIVLDSDFIVSFSEAVTNGTGYILINKSDDTLHESVDVSNASQVAFDATNVTISISTSLSPSTEYYILITNGVIEDLAGNAFAGITNDTQWSFTSAAATAPTVGNASGPSLRWQATSGFSSVTLNGEIVESVAAVTNARIYFGDSNPGEATTIGWDTVYAFPDVTGTETFSTNLTDLLFEQNYYYTVYASNAYGEAWSTVTNFATPRQLWLPTNFTAAAWYDAADDTTVTLSSGKVSQWNDVSENSNHAIQGNSSKRPTVGNDAINGLDALYYDGASVAYLDTGLLQLTNAVSIFAVLDPVGKGNNNNNTCLGANSGFTSGGLNWQVESYSGTTPLNSMWYGSALASGQKFYNGENAAPTNFSAAIFSHYGSSLSTEGLDYVIGSRGSAQFTSDNFKGYMGEVIIIPSVLSDDNRKKVEGYLAHKWGLEGELSAGHPYKNNPPYASDRGSTVFRFR